jgi:hypothetical protein
MALKYASYQPLTWVIASTSLLAASCANSVQLMRSSRTLFRRLLGRDDEPGAHHHRLSLAGLALKRLFGRHAACAPLHASLGGLRLGDEVAGEFDVDDGHGGVISRMKARVPTLTRWEASGFTHPQCRWRRSCLAHVQGPARTSGACIRVAFCVSFAASISVGLLAAEGRVPVFIASS